MIYLMVVLTKYLLMELLEQLLLSIAFMFHWDHPLSRDGLPVAETHVVAYLGKGSPVMTHPP